MREGGRYDGAGEPEQGREGRKRTLFLLFFFVFVPMISTGLHAQSDTASLDSAETYLMPPVTVVGSRLLSQRAKSVRPIALITRSEIESVGARDLADAVTFSPGLFVKRYGGLGGLRTVSLRGTASEGTALLIDGVRYRSSAEGGFDLGNIPAESLEGVEVMRGGDAALFGGNSLGGAINIVTGHRQQKMLLRGTFSVGSFGETGFGLSGSGSSGRHTIDGNLHLSRSDGDYPFLFNEFGETGTVVRENGDFSNLFARLGWSYGPEATGWELGAALHGYRTARGVPGAVVQGNRERLRARLDEDDLFGMVRGARTFDRMTLNVAASGRLNALRYRDPDDGTGGPDGIDNRFDLADGSLNGRLLWFPDDNTSVGAGLELEAVRLRGDNLDPTVADGAERRRVGGLVRGSRIVPNGLFGNSLTLEGAFRCDLFSDLDPQLAPSLGFLWQPFIHPIRLRGHAALNYRAPTFNEQYYLNFGNADLKTERSRSLSLGTTWQPTGGIVIESGIFLIDTRDRIVAVPRSPVSWSAQNLGRVLSRGLEFGVTGSLFDHLLSGSLSYTLMKTEDRSGGITDGHLIPYAPQELLNGVVTLRKWSFALTGSWEYVSHRHTLSYNTPESALPHYLVVNLGLARDFRMGNVGMTGRLDLSNLFDESYEVVRNYPMPGRSLRFEMRILWHPR